MRVNLPVNDKEVPVHEGERLISTTDLKGVIESANETFSRVAGFTLEELQGKAHNLVRHPEMPETVYQNFWDTLKADKTWMGVVKNRCKNGNYYWVSAYVSPVFQNGQQVGYQSVRTSVTEDQKKRASNLYGRLRAGKRVRSRWKLSNLRHRITLPAALGAATLVAAWALTALAPLWAQAALLIIGAGLCVAGPWLASQRLDSLSRSARDVFDNPVGNVTYGNGHDVVAEAELALAMQRSRINALRGRIEDMTDTLAESARESSAAAEGGHDAISRQTVEIEQVVTAIEEMAATVQDVSRNTAEASSATDEVAAQSEQGRAVIGQTTEAMRSLAVRVGDTAGAMQELREETHTIGGILQVINGIAEQTNLLALNAAIEAARAGESGRGFAVVASEVRELAARVTKSTSDISGMIESLEFRAQKAVDNMQQSREAANQVADDAEESSRVSIEIQSAVERIRDMNLQIATAAEEQSAVADELSRRINSVNENAGDAESMARRTQDTSVGLVGMVEELRGVLIQFAGR